MVVQTDWSLGSDFGHFETIEEAEADCCVDSTGVCVSREASCDLSCKDQAVLCTDLTCLELNPKFACEVCGLTDYCYGAYCYKFVNSVGCVEANYGTYSKDMNQNNTASDFILNGSCSEFLAPMTIQSGNYTPTPNPNYIGECPCDPSFFPLWEERNGGCNSLNGDGSYTAICDTNGWCKQPCTCPSDQVCENNRCVPKPTPTPTPTPSPSNTPSPSPTPSPSETPPPSQSGTTTTTTPPPSPSYMKMMSQNTREYSSLIKRKR